MLNEYIFLYLTYTAKHNNATTQIPAVASLFSIVLQFLILYPEYDNVVTTQESSQLNPLQQKVRRLLSRTIQFKVRPYYTTRKRQHSREQYLASTRTIEQHRFNQRIQFTLKPVSASLETIFCVSRRQVFTI